MSFDQNLKLDKVFFDEYYGIPVDDDLDHGWLKEPMMSYRKIAFKYGCSYENVRRRIDRYKSINDYINILSLIDRKIGNKLIRSGFNSPIKIRKATDKELLRIKGIGAESLREIRESFPYLNKDEEVEVIDVDKEIKNLYIQRNYSKFKQKWRRFKYTKKERRKRSIFMKNVWKERRKHE